MPIKVQGDLPAKEILERENIFVMDENRAMHQDIRPIQILIVNQRRDRAAASAIPFQYAAPDRCDLFNDEQSRIQEYLYQPSE